MNKHIKELIDQCTDGGAPQIGLDPWFNEIQFAELLIRACGDFTDPITRNIMFKHFGITDE